MFTRYDWPWGCIARLAGLLALTISPVAARGEGATRDLPPSYDAGSNFVVSFSIETPAGTLAMGLEDVPPSGWTVANMSHAECSWDPINEKIKCGPFFAGTFPDQITYDVTPPPEATGEHCFSGSVSFDGNDQPITGDECIGECVNDSGCDDGQFCNGAEVCVAGSCTTGAAPCAAGEVCDDSIDFCIQSPNVAGVGPRYLRIDVNSSDAGVGHAIRITDVAAGLDKYVDLAGVSDSCLPSGQHGMLVDDPVCRSDAGWGIIYVSDAFICPETEYEIAVGTGASCTTGALTYSNSAVGTTYNWGDLDNDNQNRIVDVLYAIDGYLCRSIAPTYVSDAGTDGNPGLPNAPDRVTTMHDIMNVMDALMGESYPYSCTSTLLFTRAADARPTINGMLFVQPRQHRIRAGDTVVVDVFLSNVSNLRGYELALDITPKHPRSLTSSLIVEGAEIDGSHVSFAFRGLDYEAVVDLMRARLGSALYSGSISVSREAVYLGSFTLRASENARGKFTVTVWPGGPAILLDPVGAKIVPAEIDAGIIHVLKNPKWPRGGG